MTPGFLGNVVVVLYVARYCFPGTNVYMFPVAYLALMVPTNVLFHLAFTGWHLLLQNRDYTQNPPRLGYQSLSDTWGLAKVVRKVEFKLLQFINGPKLMNRNVTAASLSRTETCVESSDSAS